MTDYDPKLNTDFNNVANWSASGNVDGSAALVNKPENGASQTTNKAGGSLIINSVSGDMQHPVQTVSFSPNAQGTYNPISLKTPKGVLLDKNGNQVTSFDPTTIMNVGRNEIIYLADMFIGGQQQSFSILGTQAQEKTIKFQNDDGVETSFCPMHFAILE